ncbi:MAG: hypothetical protein U1E47_03655 [Rivihabitans pingtungensis]
MIKAIVSSRGGNRRCHCRALLARQLPVLGLARGAPRTRRAQPMRPGPGRPGRAHHRSRLAGWPTPAPSWLVNSSHGAPICTGRSKTHGPSCRPSIPTSPPHGRRQCRAGRQPALVLSAACLHVSSSAAGTCGWSVYCASKAALDHHAQAVAAERHTGVRLVSLALG